MEREPQAAAESLGGSRTHNSSRSLDKCELQGIPMPCLAIVEEVSRIGPWKWLRGEGFRAPLSHPTRVRGLKRRIRLLAHRRLESHPTRVRGLKHDGRRNNRTLCRIAPHAGARIETYLPTGMPQGFQSSHPTRVRGLKQTREGPSSA